MLYKEIVRSSIVHLTKYFIENYSSFYDIDFALVFFNTELNSMSSGDHKDYNNNQKSYVI